MGDFEQSLWKQIQYLEAEDGVAVCDWIVELCDEDYHDKWSDFLGDFYVFAGFRGSSPCAFKSLADVKSEFQRIHKMN